MTGSPRLRRLVAWIFCVESVLFLAHVYHHLTWRGRRAPLGWLLFTDVRWDVGPFQWGTVLANLLVGITGFRLATTTGSRERRGWWLVGGLFCYLALDDALTLHEWLDGWVERNLVAQESVYSWTILVLPPLAVLGLVTLVFLHRTLRTTPRLLLLAWAGFGCMGLAVVLELVERGLVGSSMRLRGFAITEYTQAVEEYLEMLAPVLLLLCFGEYLHARRASGAATGEGCPVG